jgi:hypothetical protein
LHCLSDACTYHSACSHHSQWGRTWCNIPSKSRQLTDSSL